jgi:hypothetical protein
MELQLWITGKNHYRELPAWVWSAWMELTDKGERLARALEEIARDSLE